MKKRNDAGFSLVEVLVTIVILGLITIPMTSGMIVSMKTMDQAEKLMNDQLAVSSTVETLMASGISGEIETEVNDVTIVAKLHETGLYYEVTVSRGSVKVETCIRAVQGGDSQ